MTVLEFEAWVSDHYEQLIALSQQQCRAYRSTFNEELSADVLHRLIESLLEDPEQVEEFQAPRLIAWFNRALWRDAVNAQRDALVQIAGAARLADEVNTLGGDALVDAHEIAKRRRDWNAEARKRQAKHTHHGASPVMEFDGPMPGSVRWRYQQLRDNRLFDERAIRSLADSMHRASARYRHDGEHGFSFTEFGAECGHRSTQEVAR